MWYVIQVMSGEEHEKEQLFKKLILNRDGRTYDKIFVPMYVRKKRYQGKWHEEQKVLFPGYICLLYTSNYYRTVDRPEYFLAVAADGDKVFGSTMGIAVSYTHLMRIIGFSISSFV